MAVRFLPPPEERRAAAPEDRADLAEVIELRRLLPQPAWGGAGQVPDESDALDVEASDAGDVLQVEASDAGDVLEVEASDESDVLDIEASDESDAPDLLDECRQHGVKLLARRARSSGELRDELLRLSYDGADVETIIAEFEQSLYLDDAGLARVLTEKLRETKRASRSRIRLKLRERRLSDAVIEAAVGELDTDEEFELLREAAAERARKLGGLDRQTAERRLLGFLARRGWSGEPAMRAAREALDGASGAGSLGGAGGAGGMGGARGSGGAGRRGGSGVRFQ